MDQYIVNLEELEYFFCSSLQYVIMFYLTIIMGFMLLFFFVISENIAYEVLAILENRLVERR
jgi:hypothetical protein